MAKARSMLHLLALCFIAAPIQGGCVPSPRYLRSSERPKTRYVYDRYFDTCFAHPPRGGKHWIDCRHVPNLELTPGTPLWKLRRKR